MRVGQLQSQHSGVDGSTKAWTGIQKVGFRDESGDASGIIQIQDLPYANQFVTIECVSKGNAKYIGERTFCL